jgi:hypothetical protein
MLPSDIRKREFSVEGRLDVIKPTKGIRIQNKSKERKRIRKLL